MTAFQQIVSSVAVVLGAAWTMVFAGTRKRRLFIRDARRRCPSCGVVIQGRACKRH